MTKTLRIGTRGSQLAMTQTNMVRAELLRHHPGLNIEIIEIRTSGDWVPAQGETRLSEDKGGKALFAREIEDAMLAGRVDCGVHSMKDMASFLPDGLVLEHTLPREDPRDAFLSNGPRTLAELPPGAVVGTSSLRRQAMVLALRPDLKVVPIRGNVPTRIEKLRVGQVDATLLAYAGLKRLSLTHEISSVIEIDDMLPAACQGIVGIEMRAGDAYVRSLFDPLHCRVSGLQGAAERAALQTLSGSCHTPIGAYAVVENNTMTLDVSVMSPDGREDYREQLSGPVHTDENAAGLGVRAGSILKDRVPPSLLAA
ncbi:MAG TPA: hydroxymethylbilane synthase [Alphaproteobacteria bacterium]